MAQHSHSLLVSSLSFLNSGPLVEVSTDLGVERKAPEGCSRSQGESERPAVLGSQRGCNLGTASILRWAVEEMRELKGSSPPAVVDRLLLEHQEEVGFVVHKALADMAGCCIGFAHRIGRAQLRSLHHH